MGLIRSLIILVGVIRELVVLVVPFFNKSKEQKEEEINKAIVEAIEKKDPKGVQDIINKL